MITDDSPCGPCGRATVLWQPASLEALASHSQPVTGTNCQWQHWQGHYDTRASYAADAGATYLQRQYFPVQV